MCLFILITTDNPAILEAILEGRRRRRLFFNNCRDRLARLRHRVFGWRTEHSYTQVDGPPMPPMAYYPIYVGPDGLAIPPPYLSNTNPDTEAQEATFELSFDNISEATTEVESEKIDGQEAGRR